MVSCKLHYFDMRGYGETIRMILHYGNAPFEDIRYTFEDWPQHKASTKSPSGKLPFIEVDGKFLAESGAIYRYLGAKYGLVPKDTFENAQLDSIMETFRDFEIENRPYFAPGLGQTEKDEFYKTVYLPAAEKMYPRLVEIISKSKSGFLANSGLTWGDFFMAETLFTFSNMDPLFAKNYPQLVEHQKKVHAVPQIQSYLKTRKPSPI